ncbi:MAG TPA: alpha/beta hydrolase [Anaerolineales bacterium]|nr:alpha/beta hydrolase [Anaerolineales bacterium]
MSQLIAGEYDVRLNGVHIHYAVRGSGPVLIAHSGGPGMDARGWDDFAHIDDFVTVVAIHPRGSGLSGPAAGEAYLLPDYAADVETLRLHLGLDKPIVMGWSHGGMVAMQFASTFPDSLSKLILFDTSAYFGEFLSDIEGAVREFKGEPWFEKSFAALKAEWAGEYQSDEDMARLWVEEMKFYFKKFDARAEAYHERTRDLPVRISPLKIFNDKEAATLDLRPHLQKINVPTLVMVGRHDFITNVEMAEEMARHIPHARLEIFEDSGHFALIEEPEKFYRVVKQFVMNS